MSFQQGLSGLYGASKSLETIGNNIANANTVGFKAAETQFADVYASSLSGAGGGTGIGTKVSGVVQEFNQGNITASNNPLDIAINGAGFFRMSNNGSITYARNGQFQLDKKGYIVDSRGSNLTGYTVNSQGVLATANPAPLQISTADLAPSVTKSVTAQLNLDSRSTIPTTTTFKSSDPTSYNNATSVNVFDGLGNSHVLQMYFVSTGSGNWDVHGAFDDGTGTMVATTPDPLSTSPTLTFGSNGKITAPASPIFSVTITPAASTGAAPFTLNVDLNGTTQYGSSFSVNKLSQDGYTSGRLSGFNTGTDGIITGRYTNGQTAVLGQVVLANFTNPNGLQPLGNNNWAETSTSGAPLVGTPNSGSLGVLQTSATEESNVDLTAELVNMITAQRVYQANSQTIKTQDQVLQTLVNLR